jgi:hypothetical protein
VAMGERCVSPFVDPPRQELRLAHALGPGGASSAAATPLRRAAALETTTKTLEETVLDSALAI